MLHLGRDIDHVALMQAPRRLSPLLIPSFTAHTNQHLCTTVMHVPIVSATRFESQLLIGRPSLRSGAI